MRWSRNPAVLAREVAGEFVIYDPERDAVHALNATAQFIWERSDLSIEDIVEQLQSQYQVPTETARRDIETVIQTFETQGLLAPTSAQ